MRVTLPARRRLEQITNRRKESINITRIARLPRQWRQL
jgi:hypothetical protein